MKNRLKSFFILLSLLLVLGCALTGTKTTLEPGGTQPTDTPEPTTAPQEVPPQPAPDKADRWMLYEDTLASRLLSLPNVRGAGYCEWEILGQQEREVYVWAICQVAGEPDGSATSAPAVITLSSDGMIAGVDMPRDGSLWGDDARAMFPEDLWPSIFYETADIDAMWAHIQSRHTNPEPPLIALTGTLLP